MEQAQGEKKSRKTIIVVAVAAVVVLAVVLAVLKLSGGSGSTTMKRMEKLGVGYFMGLTEEEVVAALGEPVERVDRQYNPPDRSLYLRYGTEEATDIGIQLYTRDEEKSPPVANMIYFGSARTSVLGVTPDVSSAADVRQSLDKRGIYYVENDFDLNYYGARNMMQEDEGWFMTYQEDDLSYLITYDAEGEQTVREIQVDQRPKRDNPGGMRTCTQLTQRLNGQDPTVLLGMTEAQVESQFGFCGGSLNLAKDFHTNESACRIDIDHDNGTGRYTTIRLEGPGFAVQGIEVGVTTLAEADAILSAAGAREFTREAGEGVLRGIPYQELDLEALENIPLQEYERVYLTDGWYADLRFQDQILSDAEFIALEQPIDLTPPAPKELYNEAELMAAYESVYREKYLYSGSATLLADLTHDGIPELLVMSDQGGEGNRELDVYAAPKGTPKRIYSAGVSYVDSSSGYYRLYSEDGQDYLFHGFNEHSIGQPAGDIVYSLAEDGGVKTFRTGFNPDGDSRLSDIVKNSTALISPDARYTGNVFAATAQAAGDRFTVHGISFHIELPQQFKDLCTIVETGDCVEFYYTREYKGPNIGFLFDIGYYASPDDYMEWSSVLAEVPGGQLVATFPSDVQFDGMDKVSSKEYPMLQDQVSDILKTVTVQ